MILGLLVDVTPSLTLPAISGTHDNSDRFSKHDRLFKKTN